jgi:hypothetical protein
MRRHRPNFLLIATIGCVLSFTGPAHAQGGMIVNATYGAGNRQVNVTSRVQSMVQNGWLNFQVSPQTASVSDPALGVTKLLSIDVRQCNGQTNSRTFRS